MGAYKFTDLDDSLSYVVDIISNRSSASGSSRLTVVTIGGTTVQIDAADNTTIHSWTLAPTAGEILVEVSTSDGAPSSFAYMNAARLSAVPEPATLGLLGLGGLLMLRRRRTA